MRFYLDHDVDARCRRVLSPPHDCWTANEAGRALAEDDEQSVYASDQDAVVITHDQEYTERQKRNTTGRHIRLCCREWDGPKMLERWLDTILPLLRRRYIVIELHWESCKLFVDWQ